MDSGEGMLPASINPYNFPAKLWRLVNNPAVTSIYWDVLGEVIVIDKDLFERQILSPGSITFDDDTFKTTNFSSFVRQLNLYGFRSAVRADVHLLDGDRRLYNFSNPNFKRNNPDLVASLRRLTAENKARLQAGLDVGCRPPSRHQRVDGGGSSLLSPTPREETHPYGQRQPQAMIARNGTPVPPRYLMRGHGPAPSATVYSPDNGSPVSIGHHYPGVALSSSAVHIQSALLAHANQRNPHISSVNSSNPLYQPGSYYPVCHCHNMDRMAPQMAGVGLQTALFSSQSYYQAGYPVNMSGHGNHSHDLSNEEHQEVKECDINLDTVFRIADEMMPLPPSIGAVKVESQAKPVSAASSSRVKVESPKKPVSGFEPSSSTWDSRGSAVEANPLCARPFIVSVLSNSHLMKYEQANESVVSVPEEMPLDAICEVTGDHAKVGVDVFGLHGGDSHERTSSCAGSTTDL